MVEKDPLSAISAVNKGLGDTDVKLTKIQSKLKNIFSLTGQVGGGFKSAFSFSGTGQGSSMGLGTSNASFGGGAGGVGMMMPWLYTKSGAATYGAAQTAMGIGAAAYSLTPDLSVALPTRTAYYTNSLMSRGMTAAGLAQRTIGALAGGVTSPTDAAAASAMMSLGYNYNPGGSSYLRAMQEVGGAARMMNIANPQAAQAIGGLHTGDMSSRLYQVGISTLDPRTGTTRSTEDIFRQLYNRYYGGKGQITAQNIEVGLREGFIGKELRSVFGFNDTQMQMFQQAAINFSQGKNFNLPDATGKGNPALDIYRQQTSLAVTTETKADELLAGLTTATDAYVKMNESLQGDGGLVSGFAKLKGVLQGIFGTNAGGAVSALVSTAGTVATTALAFKGMKAAGLIGSKGAMGAATTAATAAAGKTLLVDAAGKTLLTAGAATGGAVAARTAGTMLGRAVPVLGGAIGGATGQGFLSTVAIGAVGGGIFGGLPGAALGGGLSALGWLGAKAVGAMMGTSKSQQVSGTTGDLTEEQWAVSLLQRMGAPTTSSNVSAIMTWMRKEGGHWKNTADYNPLNTTLGAPGAKSMNKVGVKAYNSWDQGLQATLDTLQGTKGAGYEKVLAALRQGTSTSAVLQAVEQSSWAGKGGYKGSLLAMNPVPATGSASTSVSSGNQTVNINLTIDKASDAEAIALAKKVKEILMKDKTLAVTGSK